MIFIIIILLVLQALQMSQQNNIKIFGFDNTVEY